MNPTSPDNWPDWWHDLLAGHALGHLSAEEAETLKQLLERHPHLEAELAAYEQVLGMLPEALPQVAPPAHLERTLLAAAQTGSDADGAAGSPPSAAAAPPFYRRPLVWLLGIVAIAALGGLALDNWRLRRALVKQQQDLRSAQTTIRQLQQHLDQAEAIWTTLKQPSSRVYAMEGIGSFAEISGRLITVPGHSEVALVAPNLEPLPRGQRYRLWVVTKAQPEPIYCGQFNPSASGAALWTIPATTCLESPQQMLITINEATSPPLPGGEPVMQTRSS